VEDDAVAQPDIGFERMRAMLGRAAEVRADEQRQVVDLLDEVRARLTPVEEFVGVSKEHLESTHGTVSAIQDRLSTLPDRDEVSVIAERLDEALTRIDAQEQALRDVTAAVSALSDRVGRPLDSLDGRLDGVAGRFEGVSGRLDGLDDRLQHVHGRLDELDGELHRLQGGVDALPGALDLSAVHRRFDELAGSVHQRFDDDLGRVHGRLDDLLGRPVVDPAERIDALTSRLEQLGERLDGVVGQIRSVDESVRNNFGSLAGSLERGIDKLHGDVQSRPDRDELVRTLRKAQQESERRITQQLDNVLADFAEVVLAQNVGAKPTRATARKPAKKAEADAEG
jgi:chromosome segregation ATPase